MSKRVVLAIFVIAVLGSSVYTQKKKPKRAVIYGSKVVQPSKEEVAGKLDAEDEYNVYSSIIVSLFGDDKNSPLSSGACPATILSVISMIRPLEGLLNMISRTWITQRWMTL